MPLPPALHIRIAKFLTSLPNISNPQVQQALISASALEPELKSQIVFPGASFIFVEALIPTLLDYGTLRDGRYALEAVLEAAKNLVGTDRKAECAQLLEKFRDNVAFFLPEQVEFVNRAHEIDLTTNVFSSPYLVITAPMGYGKTRLLDVVKQSLLKQRCFCLHLPLSGTQLSTCADILNALLRQLGKPSIGNLPLEQHGSRVGQAILRTVDQSQQHIVVLLDNIELLDEHLVREFLNTALPAINVALQNALMPLRLRLIATGRAIACRTTLDFTLPVERMSLSPFNFSAVHKTVNEFDATNPAHMNPEYKRTFAALLMAFTGGHPGCMVSILREDYGILIEDVLTNEPRHYSTIVRPVIQEIYHNIPDNLKKIVKALSAFRIYNFSLLQELIDTGIIPYPGKATQLGQELTATYLVKRKEGFIRDSIMRRLCAIEFRKETEPETFREFCDKAPQIYEHSLRENDYHAHSVALESVYQKLQGAYYCSQRTVGARTELREQFFAPNGILNTYLTILAEKQQAEDISANFKALLDSDWEFRFTLNFFLRENSDYTNAPYERLCQHVETFFARGENHD